MALDYSKYYSEGSFIRKIKRYGRIAGTKVVYSGLLLSYALQHDKMPVKNKLAIIAALGYFISPVDTIPDILAGLGYADDLSVLLGVAYMVYPYIDDMTREKARKKIEDWFGYSALNDLDEVDGKPVIGAHTVIH